MPAEVNSVARTGGHEVRGRRATCDFSLILYPRRHAPNTFKAPMPDRSQYVTIRPHAAPTNGPPAVVPLRCPSQG
eukprot:scaffold123473_cov57-Phaeocystis_antarctica.AAC.2